MKKALLDFADEIHRVTSRANLLQLALVHTNEAGTDGHFGEAIAQQSQDVANQLTALCRRLDDIRGEERASS